MQDISQLVEHWKKLIEDQDESRFEKLGNRGNLVKETSRRQKAQQAIKGIGKKVKSIAILTSENPHFDDPEHGLENFERRKNLEHDLRSSHIAWFPIKGKYGEYQEKSYILFNVSREDAIRLGKKYGQESVIFISGNKCEFWSSEDGKKYQPTQIRTLDQTIDATSEEDNFSQISRAFKFRIPFFDGSEENMELYQGMLDYIEESLEKRDLDEATINRLIDDNVNDKSVGFNKWAHNGRLYRTDFWW